MDLTKKLLLEDKVRHVLDILQENYPDAKCALNFNTNFELLIATILSAQCTDQRVNKVTEVMFKEFNKPVDFAYMEEDTLQNFIKSCGMYKQKSKNIINMSRIVQEKFNGVIPENFEELVELPGVGRKTANVVLCNAFGKPAFAVDTHVFRVSNRIGLADSDNVVETEKQLTQNIPESEWCSAHHLLIAHGRNVCKARNPNCSICSVNSICSYFNITGGEQ